MILTRREMLQRAGAGFGMLGLAATLNGAGLPSGESSPLGARTRLHFKPRAKRVIFLFMNGAPSHVDTFDPKPELAKRVRQAPLVEDRSRHGERRTNKLRRVAGEWVIEQPAFERVRGRIVFDGALQQVPFHAQTKRISRLIAFAIAPSSFRSLERGE